MSIETIAVYFGCWDAAGHYLWTPNKHGLTRHDADRMLIPTAGTLDGSLLFLPRPEKKGTGSLTYLPAPNRTILAWWGSPWDNRGAVNAAFITNGDLGETAMWQRFIRHFPDLSTEIKQPTIAARKESS